jgi:hypothetical protein
MSYTKLKLIKNTLGEINNSIMLSGSILNLHVLLRAAQYKVVLEYEGFADG